MRYLIILILALTGCGRAPKDMRAQKYIDNFELTFKAHTDHITVMFIDSYPKEPDLLAYCAGNYVVIMGNWWDLMSETEKESTIFHELGHCVFDLDHKDSVFSDGCYSSYMSTYMDSDQCLTKHRNELILDMKRDVK